MALSNRKILLWGAGYIDSRLSCTCPNGEEFLLQDRSFQHRVSEHEVFDSRF